MQSEAQPTSGRSTVATFEKCLVPVLYDALVSSIYLPVGGERALRAEAIEQLAIVPGELELGCGTGSFTRLLLGAGAITSAIDGSSRMIERARRKAPDAHYRCQDLRALRLDDDERYDTVLMGFVLHELDPAVRHALFVRLRAVPRRVVAS